MEKEVLEFKVGGKQFRCFKLPAMKAFHILRRLLPALSGIATADGDVDNLLSNVGAKIAEMPDEQANYIWFGLLSSVQLKQGGGNWADVCKGDLVLFDDLDLVCLLQIVGKSAHFNFADFFALPPSALGAAMKPE